MPELPEVETVRRGLEPAMLGERFARVEQKRPDLRFPLPEHFAERLTGRRVEALSRRAYEQVPYISFAQWRNPVAYRADRLSGVITMPSLPPMWNIEKK